MSDPLDHLRKFWRSEVGTNDPRRKLDPAFNEVQAMLSRAKFEEQPSKPLPKREPMAAFIEVRGVPVKIEELFQDDVKSLVTSFLELQTVFPEEIQGIYYVPGKYINPDTGLADRINLVVKVRALCLIAYMNNSSSDKKSLVDYWNDKNADKERFWNIRTTKLLLTLMQLHNRSKLLSIWVSGFASIMSVEMFNDPTKLVKISPDEMFKLVR
jgi:hypothetical protein